MPNTYQLLLTEDELGILIRILHGKENKLRKRMLKTLSPRFKAQMTAYIAVCVKAYCQLEAQRSKEKV